MLAFIQNIGLPELLVVLVIVLLLFGAGKLPEIARSIGKSLNEFKKGVKEVEKDVKDTQKEDEDPKS